MKSSDILPSHGIYIIQKGGESIFHALIKVPKLVFGKLSDSMAVLSKCLSSSLLLSTWKGYIFHSSVPLSCGREEWEVAPGMSWPGECAQKWPLSLLDGNPGCRWKLLQRCGDCRSMRAQSSVSDSLQPHGLQPTGLLCPWDSPGKSTRAGCHSLLQGSSQPRHRACVSCISCIAGGFFIAKPLGKPL